LVLLLDGIRQTDFFQPRAASQAAGELFGGISAGKGIRLGLGTAFMKCFVTGASGFVGSNLVQELLARGHRVKVLLRLGADERGLQGLKFERVTGDILDRKLLLREMDGCDWCFHVAASYQLWMRHYAPMYEINVEGTRNVLEAAGKVGCRKIIYTSTVGCIGLPKEAKGKITPATEYERVSEDQMNNDYKRSKFRAEVVASDLFRKAALPVIIVNPSAPIGPGDVKPTPTGRIIVDFLNGRMPAYLETGLNWVHVRDVAVGHILAAEKGTLGQRYILGHQQGNWTMQQTFAVLEKITGIPAPKVKIPYWLAYRVAEVNEYIAFFTGQPPRAPMAGVRMAKYKMWFDPEKAVRELGLPQTPPEQAFADAVAWFRANGYVKK
jgi:dihydroflavonol-4-reductase